MKAMLFPDPGYWVEEASGLRALESRLIALWISRGFSEVLPPLILPESPSRAACPEPLATRALSLSGGREGATLRVDFTSGVSRMASRRLPELDRPFGLCYRGAVLRLPLPDALEGAEVMQAGCERLSPEPGPEGDLDVSLLAAETLSALALNGAVLELGDRQIAGPLLDRTGWAAEVRPELERALDLKSLPLLESLGERHGGSPEWRLLKRLVHAGPECAKSATLRADLHAAGVGEAWDRLCRLSAEVRTAFPSLGVRLEVADVRHWSYYTGLTLKAFVPEAPQAILSGGRYDGLYPSMGRPFGACGFALYVGRLLGAARHSSLRGTHAREEACLASR